MTRRDAAVAAAGVLAGAGTVIAAAAGWVWLACRTAADEQLDAASAAYWRAQQARRHVPKVADVMVQPALVDNVLAHAGFCPRPGCDYGRVLTDSGRRCDLHAVPDLPAEHDPAPETINDCDDPWCNYGLPAWLTGPDPQLCDRHRDTP